MNHIFKTVWDDTSQSWIAVSELAKSQGGKSSIGGGGLINAVKKWFKMTLGALSVMLALSAVPVEASVILNDVAGGVSIYNNNGGGNFTVAPSAANAVSIAPSSGTEVTRGMVLQ